MCTDEVVQEISSECEEPFALDRGFQGCEGVYVDDNPTLLPPYRFIRPVMPLGTGNKVGTTKVGLGCGALPEIRWMS